MVACALHGLRHGHMCHSVVECPHFAFSLHPRRSGWGVALKPTAVARRRPTELAVGAGVARLHARPYDRPVNCALIKGRQKAPLSGEIPTPWSQPTSWPAPAPTEFAQISVGGRPPAPPPAHASCALLGVLPPTTRRVRLQPRASTVLFTRFAQASSEDSLASRNARCASASALAASGAVRLPQHHGVTVAHASCVYACTCLLTGDAKICPPRAAHPRQSRLPPQS